MHGRTALRLGITAHRLSNNVTFYTNNLASTTAGWPSHGSGEHRPLMLMLPWYGSRPQAIAKYCDIYFRTGLDVLVVESEVKEFLWPRWGLERSKTLLELLQSDQFASRPLLVHAFSIGGFTFAQLLVHVSQDTLKYQGLIQRIKGQVYDSLVVGSLEVMAKGLGKTVFPQWEMLIRKVSLLYFSVFRRHTVDHFNTGIGAFRSSPVTAPALFFYCENDAMSDPRAMEELVDHLRKHGVEVTAKKWEDSTHAGHLKRHPQEYLATLNHFITSLHVLPLKAKM
ncbi:transmembrane protein 53-A [Nelusetta ayraudi]|uniref:transmembrane protein 53-A n=1 Tax=Nelusetta ayraudi TaxID=303726 RepID=UPI003F718B11